MHVHLDLMGGLAGDMFLAAAIDAGVVDVEALEDALRTLGLGRSIRIVPERVRRGAIEGTHVHFEGWDPAAESDHRHLSTILGMLDESKLPPRVRERAKAMFELLGASEAKIHGIPLEKVHFHEVGAVDSLLDMASAAWVIEHLDATWSVGEIPAGRGTIETAHGTIPLPAPATADLLRGMSIVQLDVEAELVTPTGATILRTLEPGAPRKTGVVQAVGYGCGTRELPHLSNVVRLMAFRASEKNTEDFERDVVTRIACEIDDMNPETLAYVAEVDLPAAGALDVVREPVLMKKGRAATRITVLAPEEATERVVDCLLRRTTSFGVRVERVERYKLRRRHETVETRFGSIRVKIGLVAQEVVRRTPEFEDCARAAAEHDVPIEAVYEEVLRTLAPEH